MLTALVDRLACPWCRAGSLEAIVEDGDADVIRRGVLHCGACGRSTEVLDGIWHALGPHRPRRNAAQLTNRVPVVSQLYEAVWRRRSLSLLSGRHFPVPEELSELATWLAPHPGQVVVDVGCSEGLYARRLARQGTLVLAVDHALGFLKAAQRRAAAAGVLIAPVQALAQHLPILDGAADAFAMGGSLNELGDQAEAATELGRVVRPGGRGFSMSLVRGSTARGRALQSGLGVQGIDFPTPEATEQLFTAAGFGVVARRRDRVVLRLDLERD